MYSLCSVQLLEQFHWECLSIYHTAKTLHLMTSISSDHWRRNFEGKYFWHVESQGVLVGANTRPWFIILHRNQTGVYHWVKYLSLWWLYGETVVLLLFVLLDTYAEATNTSVTPPQMLVTEHSLAMPWLRRLVASLTVEAQVSLCEICDGQSDNTIGLSGG